MPRNALPRSAMWLSMVTRWPDHERVRCRFSFGQIAGAYYRRDGIPGEWVRRLASSERIEEIAAALYAAGPGRECGHSARGVAGC